MNQWHPFVLLVSILALTLAPVVVSAQDAPPEPAADEPDTADADPSDGADDNASDETEGGEETEGDGAGTDEPRAPKDATQGDEEVEETNEESEAVDSETVD